MGRAEDRQSDLWFVESAVGASGEEVQNVVLRTHSKEECRGRFCCLHNPSDHPLKDFPLKWREDIGVMERVCKHGIGHTDPDDLAYRLTLDPYALDVHACDGCC